ncbi:MAG: hypothetical protein R3F60_05405 [bacterium]
MTAPASPRRGRVVLVAALAVAGAAALALWLRPGPALTLIAPAIPAATWDAYVEAVRAAPAPPAPEALLAAVAKANRAEAAGRGPAAASAIAARAEAAWRYVQLRTPEAYVQLGRLQGLALQARLDALLGWCRAEGRAVSEALAMDPPPQVVTDWLEVGGAFLQFAEDAGLVADERLVDAHRPFTQAIFLHHWLAPLRTRLPLEGYLRGDERTWFLRWKVELQEKGIWPRASRPPTSCAPWRATPPISTPACCCTRRAAATRRWRGCGRPRSPRRPPSPRRSSRRDEPGAPPAQLRPLRRAVRRHLHRPAAAEDRGPRRSPAR